MEARFFLQNFCSEEGDNYGAVLSTIKINGENRTTFLTSLKIENNFLIINIEITFGRGMINSLDLG